MTDSTSHPTRHTVVVPNSIDMVSLLGPGDEHLGMIEAIRAGDRARLVALCRKHLGPSRDAYIAAAEARFARSKTIAR